MTNHVDKSPAEQYLAYYRYEPHREYLPIRLEHGTVHSIRGSCPHCKSDLPDGAVAIDATLLDEQPYFLDVRATCPHCGAEDIRLFYILAHGMGELDDGADAIYGPVSCADIDDGCGLYREYRFHGGTIHFSLRTELNVPKSDVESAPQTTLTSIGLRAVGHISAAVLALASGLGMALLFGAFVR